MTLGKISHLIHMTGDLAALDAWYDDVFGVKRGWMDNDFLDMELRDASLLTVGDIVIETVAPSFHVDGWDSYPLGRFYNRFGDHWHSISWYADETMSHWKKLHDNNIRILGSAGAKADTLPRYDAPLFTHPRDTIAQLEIEPPCDFADADPRQQSGYDPLWWVNNHPLGLYGLSYTTVLTDDLEKAKKVFVDLLDGDLLEESSSKLTGTDDIYVKVGDAVIQASRPIREDTIAADDFRSSGEIHHAACFRVADLDKAEIYLESKGIRTVARDEHTVLSDPRTTHGAVFRWTDRLIPGGTYTS
ncbi:hypothetical protein [Gordonia rhizosphera]|uniref:VOC domain-containing protein n=1 Tax=Gordonia rhizosphera NBRC 16068 TaxID=1108045 RepID=K6V817_9ACTN|nr:hypothetical protein [Gordonia rhizosphera]GAB92343.1 hypothetical protein GORHZ_171_00160 [Gordonia rhizosphera NBRC 16068]